MAKRLETNHATMVQVDTLGHSNWYICFWSGTSPSSRAGGRALSNGSAGTLSRAMTHVRAHGYATDH